MDLDEGWNTTALLIPDGRWKNELTGEAVSGGETKLAQLTARFPLALLSREED
jgi:(1->4)-alpha-D-glucan 1-alpha-D-glucosylmutase